MYMLINEMENDKNLSYNFKIKMSKCEHGQKITIFCATQCCVWKEAGGCPACIKKYHNHMGPTIFVTQDETNKFVKKYNVDPAIKYKCRSLQEAIFNYFNLIKAELDTFLDGACIDIMNQIGHPYLTQNNLFTTYKRLKKKDYKKIQQKDFKIFYEASQRLSDKELNEKQGKIYLEKVKKKNQFINAIQKSIRSVEKVNKDHDEAYYTNHDGSASLKINQIVKNIFKNYQKSESKNQRKNSQSFKLSQKLEKIQVNFEINQTHDYSSKTNETSKKKSILEQQVNQLESEQCSPKMQEKNIDKIRPARLSSLDKQFTKANKLQKKRDKQKQANDTSINWKMQPDSINEKQLNKKENDDLRSPKKRYFDTKQVEINQKKQKLIDMMKQKQQYVPSASAKLKVPTHVMKSEKSDNKISEKSASGIGEDGSGDSFDHKDQNMHFFAHTALPRTESRQKIFLETEQVQTTIIVPVDVKKIEANKIQQCQSPIMKNKYKSKQLKSKYDESNNDNFQIIPKKVKSKEELVYEHDLDDKKEKSLALLIKSLSLKTQEAIPYLQKALSFAEDNLSAAEYLSYLYLEINRPKQSLTLCNQMLEKLQNSSDRIKMSWHLNINKAAALNMLGRYSQSIVIAQESLKDKPNQKLFKILGDSYFSIGIFQKASYCYEKAVGLCDSFDEAHYNLAVCLFSQENYYNAKFSIMKALQSSPKNQAYLELQKEIMLRIKQY